MAAKKRRTAPQKVAAPTVEQLTTDALAYQYIMARRDRQNRPRELLLVYNREGLTAGVVRPGAGTIERPKGVLLLPEMKVAKATINLWRRWARERNLYAEAE